MVRQLAFVGPVFFSELRSPSPMQDARFLHFAGCLEAFHREVVQADVGKFMPKSEYRALVQSVLEQMPSTVCPELRDSMRSSLSHANSHSFSERIDALFGELELETQIQLTKEPKRFLAAIKHSRNKLAHVSEEMPGETFEGREYAHANLCIRAWLQTLILKRCGIPESLIRNRMAGIGYFYWGPFSFESKVGS